MLTMTMPIMIILLISTISSNAQQQLRGVSDDVCGDFKGCGACSQEANCGWCATGEASAGLCMKGNEHGPNDGTEMMPSDGQPYDVEKKQMHMYGCKDWKFSQCSISVSCSTYKSCGRCIADPFCGWCSSTSQCEEGTSAGPIAGLGSGCVSGTYAHSPMLPDASASTIEALVSSAQESMESHQKHLAHICESATLNATHHLMSVITHEREINETLRDLIRTCSPCAGTWPRCDCEGHEPSTNNVDKDYVPGSVYVKFEGDEAVKASVTGLGPPVNPQEAAARKSRKIATTLSQQMATATQEYIRAIEQLGRARLLEDPQMIQDAELAVQEADALLGKARAKARAAAEAANAYMQSNHAEAIQTLVDAAQKQAHNAVSKTASILHGDSDGVSSLDEDNQETELNADEASSVSTSSDSTATDTDEGDSAGGSETSRNVITSDKDDEGSSTHSLPAKFRFRETQAVLEPGPR